MSDLSEEALSEVVRDCLRNEVASLIEEDKLWYEKFQELQKGGKLRLYEAYIDGLGFIRMAFELDESHGREYIDSKVMELY